MRVETKVQTELTPVRTTALELSARLLAALKELPGDARLQNPAAREAVIELLEAALVRVAARDEEAAALRERLAPAPTSASPATSAEVKRLLREANRLVPELRDLTAYSASYSGKLRGDARALLTTIQKSLPADGHAHQLVARGLASADVEARGGALYELHALARAIVGLDAVWTAGDRYGADLARHLLKKIVGAGASDLASLGDFSAVYDRQIRLDATFALIEAWYALPDGSSVQEAIGAGLEDAKRWPRTDRVGARNAVGRAYRTARSMLSA